MSVIQQWIITMMTLHVNSSVPTAKTLTSAAAALNSSSHHRGPDAAGFSSHSNYRLGAGGGRVTVSQSHHFRRKYPVIEPLRSKYQCFSLDDIMALIQIQLA